MRPAQPINFRRATLPRDAVSEHFQGCGGSASVFRDQGQYERVAGRQHRLLDLFWRRPASDTPRRSPWAAASRSIPAATCTSPARRTTLYTGCSGCSSTDFPILNAYQPCLDQAPPAVIVNPPHMHEYHESDGPGRLRGEAQSQSQRSSGTATGLVDLSGWHRDRLRRPDCARYRSG